MDSGCTAVVAVVDDKGTLYVANAGDSRCIISRKGVAMDMSVDHKPEDEEECKRIVQAGGDVTAEGRVNGGLNLSRALGEQCPNDALPDVRKIKLRRDEDEFMVLACDGIWNSMTSQDVVDFMFDHCLAPNTSGDGTGCDNMTAILVTFKPEMFKGRSEEGEAKEEGDIVVLTPPPSPELPEVEEEEESSSEEEEEDEEEEVEEEKVTGKGCKRGLESKESAVKSKKAKVEEEVKKAKEPAAETS
ncbi:hypothetical protein J437_LFUL018101 [Ladona fulva]|uniref:protein-serine/threonine phosphatase n=1 Tax=Ladona fulva TaxID=123851 RepID=A0A8K0PAP7_LADFU|nr:hypothetical protein J437_LFUL018101 [Ladona fulva]